MLVGIHHFKNSMGCSSAFFQIALKFGLVLKVSEVWLRKPVRKGEVWPMGDRSLCSDSDFFNSARNEKSYENRKF